MAFDLRDLAVLWLCLSLNGVSEKFILLIQSTHAKNPKSNLQLSQCFTEDHQETWCSPASAFLYNFVKEMVMEIAQSACQIFTQTGNYLTWGVPTLLCYWAKIQLRLRFFHCLNDSLRSFGVGFARLYLKMLLQDWIASKPNLFLTGKQPNEVDRLSYFGICISPGGHKSDEVSSCIHKTWLAFVNLRNLWGWRDSRLSIKVKYTWLYGSETWHLGV